MGKRKDAGEFLARVRDLYARSRELVNPKERLVYQTILSWAVQKGTEQWEDGRWVLTSIPVDVPASRGMLSYDGEEELEHGGHPLATGLTENEARTALQRLVGKGWLKVCERPIDITHIGTRNYILRLRGEGKPVPGVYKLMDPPNENAQAVEDAFEAAFEASM